GCPRRDRAAPGRPPGARPRRTPPRCPSGASAPAGSGPAPRRPAPRTPRVSSPAHSHCGPRPVRTSHTRTSHIRCRTWAYGINGPRPRRRVVRPPPCLLQHPAIVVHAPSVRATPPPRISGAGLGHTGSMARAPAAVSPAPRRARSAPRRLLRRPRRRPGAGPAGLAPRHRPWTRALGLIMVVLVGAWLGLLVVGNVRVPVGPMDTTMTLRPSFTGGTKINVSPLGALQLDSHTAPLRLDVN